MTEKGTAREGLLLYVINSYYYSTNIFFRVKTASSLRITTT